MEHELSTGRISFVESSCNLGEQRNNAFEGLTFLIIYFQRFVEELKKFAEVNEVTTDVVNYEVHLACLLELLYYSP